MASYSSTVVLLVMICACGWLEKVVCRRPVGGAAQYDAADGSYMKEAAAAAEWRQGSGFEKSGGATWKQLIGFKGPSGATWKKEIGCSPCEEVYVVRDEGETLQTISEKCHAPFILLDNPHVQDTDDISTGSVLFISSTHLPCNI